MYLEQQAVLLLNLKVLVVVAEIVPLAAVPAVVLAAVPAAVQVAAVVAARVESSVHLMGLEPHTCPVHLYKVCKKLSCINLELIVQISVNLEIIKFFHAQLA